MDRVIFHVDCNGFYASVECLDNPALWDVPLAVAGDPKDRSGIILAKNEHAKKFGVITTETINQARRKCPRLVLVPPRHDRYYEVSLQVKRMFSEYTDQVESFGVDEAWMDVTQSLKLFEKTPMGLADSLRERVKREIGITVSVGVSFNKVFAKLGSDMKKPDATTEITRENYRRLVWTLPARSLLFVGRAADSELERHLIKTIGDIAQSDRGLLESMFGKGGNTLWRYANGLDDAPVRRIDEHEPVKSIGNGMTFRRDLVGYDELKSGIVALSDEVATRLRREQVKCRTVQVTIKNAQLKSITRQMSFVNPTHLQKELVDASMALIREHWNDRTPVRALTVTAQNLTKDDEAYEQLSLLDVGAQGDTAKRERLERLENALHDIRLKYGSRCISMGYVESEELGIRQFKQDDLS